MELEQKQETAEEDDDQFALTPVKAEITEADESKEPPHEPFIESIKYKTVTQKKSFDGPSLVSNNPLGPQSVMDHCLTEPNLSSSEGVL